MIHLLDSSNILTKYHMKMMDELLNEYDSGFIREEFATVTINFTLIGNISIITKNDLGRIK